MRSPYAFQPRDVGAVDCRKRRVALVIKVAAVGCPVDRRRRRQAGRGEVERGGGRGKCCEKERTHDPSTRSEQMSRSEAAGIIAVLSYRASCLTHFPCLVHGTEPEPAGSRAR